MQGTSGDIRQKLRANRRDYICIRVVRFHTYLMPVKSTSDTRLYDVYLCVVHHARVAGISAFECMKWLTVVFHTISTNLKPRRVIIIQSMLPEFAHFPAHASDTFARALLLACFNRTL